MTTAQIARLRAEIQHSMFRDEVLRALDEREALLAAAKAAVASDLGEAVGPASDALGNAIEKAEAPT